MTELPIIVADEQLSVGGLVDTINLEVDIGPQGDRGAIIFSGTSEPTNTTVVDSVYGTVDSFQPGDLYIKQGTPYHGWLYIFKELPGGSEWVPIFPIQKSLYFKNHTLTFTSGTSSTLSIPLTDIISSGTAPAAENFIVNVTPQNNNTYVYIVSVKTVAKNGNNLDIVFNGRTIQTTTIANSSGNISANISIGVLP